MLIRYPTCLLAELELAVDMRHGRIYLECDKPAP